MRLSDLIEKLQIKTGSRLGVTGSRRGMTPHQVIKFVDLVNRLRPKSLRHGCCIGADCNAHDAFYVVTRGWQPRPNIYGYPSDMPDYVMPNLGKRAMFLHPPADCLERNRAICEDVDYLVACPSSAMEEQRSGTWSTIRYMRKLGKAILILLPSGASAEYPVSAHAELI